MKYRTHLFSLRIGHALRESLKEAPYKANVFYKDLLAGLTVGIIAIPLAMALAIAIGVAPQYGLYTAIIGGFIIPLTGGSRYSVSGPTAAFVVILYPIVQQYGLSGLLLASILSGVILIAMALLRLGRFIQYIPESVTLGFTGGIAVVIVVLQVKDFLGLSITEMPENFVGKVLVLTQVLPTFSLPTLLVGLSTLVVFILWPKLKLPVPAHLPAVIIASIVALVLNQFGFHVATIDSTFSFTLADGSIGMGIPSMLPDFQWPWLRNQLGETPLILTWQLVSDLLSAAFAIAMLGAIESLLCAVVLDGMSGKKHSANSELLGQGIGNIITPFFGGITATAAIARSAANYKAGAVSPIAAIIHALVVLVSLLSLSTILAYIPMAGMSALLIMVAWNMSEAPKIIHLVKQASTSEVLVLLVCLLLTIFFDMVIAISAGIILASLLFMKQVADMTKVQDISKQHKHVHVELPSRWKVFKINGPLFFAAADSVFAELTHLSVEQEGVVLYFDGVSILDSGGVAALYKFIAQCKQNNTRVLLADFQFQPLKTLAKAGFKPDGVQCVIYSTLVDALNDVVK
ncbi:C4-dicarboxylic acid transporter DauA [Shewanella sp. OMA3-2]|uniref:C4-dicarboxylic acid transporter DauA n=1 Tax=Shewanella sp. OMA3-2 TaxID=2908650 RepID=UPI001F437D23|nr:C4-dicarboxylic acid transporter DauA [Shewanella sp. OMA3-2]UJF20778.1 C4-dicarboxylic acid transporter DauA [Shewanella sp. OMA3-2]